MANTNYDGQNRDENRKGTSRRGFASMDQQKQREIASKGGKASAAGDTSNRGFASMDEEKQRRIASVGGKASGEARRNNSLRNRLNESGSMGLNDNNTSGEWRENSGRSRGE